MSLFDTFFRFGRRAAPVRRDLNARVTSHDGVTVITPVDGNAIAVSPPDAIDRLTVVGVHDGCNCASTTPPGGVCAECGRWSCRSCFTRCAGSSCHKPLCQRHNIVDPETNKTYCRRCSDALGRSRLPAAAYNVVRRAVNHLDP